MQPQAIAIDVFRERYAAAGEHTLQQLRERVAAALAIREPPARREYWRQRFVDAQMQGFIAGGRINASAGRAADDASQAPTLINCFVNPIAAAPAAAFAQTQTTLQLGGGVGLNFSALAPCGSAGGGPTPLAAIGQLDADCEHLRGRSTRHGALMGVLAVDHPDIFAFIAAKQAAGVLRNFNLSVAITDVFMRAVDDDADIALLHAAEPSEAVLARGAYRRDDGLWVYRHVAARSLWLALLRSAYDCSEPGVLFPDRINSENNLGWCEVITATNPCAEQPLPDFGACCLGSINLTALVVDAFSPQAHVDVKKLRSLTRVAVRMLDNVLDITAWPLREQQEQAVTRRRIGLGVTGLADALIMLGHRYDRRAGREIAVRLLRTLRNAAYAESVRLAKQRGAFPAFDAERYLQQPFIRRLPKRVREGIRRHGIRNSHLISIAPAGSISLAFADNASSGIEPAFAWQYTREHHSSATGSRRYDVGDFAWRLYRERGGDTDRLPPAFVSALEIDPLDHLRMVAALQPYVDAGISKTINIATDYPFEKFQMLYRQAWQWGLKGLTTFRLVPAQQSVLARRHC
jgi:ribonucleoside-diphosphate reductase alpha chain